MDERMPRSVGVRCEGDDAMRTLNTQRAVGESAEARSFATALVVGPGGFGTSFGAISRRVAGGRFQRCGRLVWLSTRSTVGVLAVRGGDLVIGALVVVRVAITVSVVRGVVDRM